MNIFCWLLIRRTSTLNHLGSKCTSHDKCTYTWPTCPVSFERTLPEFGRIRRIRETKPQPSRSPTNPTIGTYPPARTEALDHLHLASRPGSGAGLPCAFSPRRVRVVAAVGAAVPSRCGGLASVASNSGQRLRKLRWCVPPQCSPHELGCAWQGEFVGRPGSLCLPGWLGTFWRRVFSLSVGSVGAASPPVLAVYGSCWKGRRACLPALQAAAG